MTRSIILFIALWPGFRSVAQTICQIQGTGASSPYVGLTVTTEGVVTALFSGTGSLNGYFLEQPNCDADPLTSNGIFVYDSTPTGVSVGQRLAVTATVVEFNGVTELTNPGIQVLGSGNVTPTDLLFPIASMTHWERYEGMLLRFPGTMVVTDNARLFQYGELTLAPSRSFTPTEHIDPNDAVPAGTNSTGQSNAAAVNAELDLLGRSQVVMDDGRTNSYPSPTPWLGPEGTLRIGSTVTGLTGVLHYSFGEYKLEPVGSVPISLAARPDVPEIGNGLRAASLNVLNYFTTLGQWGAQNAGELARQRLKLVSAIQALDPDVLALCEVENSDAARDDLLGALNAATGANTYVALEEDAWGGGTRMMILYKQAAVEPVGPLYALYTGLFQRPHLTQGFRAYSTGGRFLFSSVHLRSKLCDNATGANLDQGDGQGCYNSDRRAQAAALVSHWAEVRATTGIQTQLIMGDLNAYAEEDPLDVLRAAGLQRLAESDGYSYTYQGRSGSLDHAFATWTMADAVGAAAVWHINSDEPEALDYSDANLARFQPNAFRCSDHDPMLVGFSAAQLPVAIGEVPDPISVRALVSGRSVTWLVPQEQGGVLTVVDARGVIVESRQVGGTSFAMDLSQMSAGIYTWRITGPMWEGQKAVGRFTLL